MKKAGNIVGVIVFMVVVVALCVFAYRYFTADIVALSGDEWSSISGEEKNPSSGDTEKQPVDTTPLFSSGDYPRVDASLATQPLTDAFQANFLGIPETDIVTDYTNTHPGFVKLIDGEVDMVVRTALSEEEIAYAQEHEVEVEVIPVVNEAFVFLANQKNPVKGLTLSQIQDIYSGKITNWSEVGGEDKAIIPYQRPVNSGSQTGMLELVMKDIPMISPTTETFEETMAGLIEAIADYDNSEAALGYSYYYYANTMYSKNTVRLLAVDGVEPNNQTIQNGTYPIQTAYYIVIRKSEPEESNTRKLVAAMLSERGQQVAEEAGYVPVKAN